MFERVTVAIDGGPASEAALAWVVDRARDHQFALEITSVVDVESELPPGAEAEYRVRHEDVLLRAKSMVSSVAPNVIVSTKIRRGIPHVALLAASRQADLLVIGANRSSAAAGIVHGTVPLKVAGRAQCITVVVPAGWRPNEGKVVAGWSDDETAETALDFAATEASEGGAELAVVHTWRAPPATPFDGSGADIMVKELSAANLTLLSDAAHRVELRHPGLKVSREVRMGSAALAIARAAEGASLVVVGCRGRGAITGFFLGSVSHDILMRMPAPVAVVPRKDEPVDVYPELVDEDL